MKRAMVRVIKLIVPGVILSRAACTCVRYADTSHYRSMEAALCDENNYAGMRELVSHLILVL
jgi:hypothetical protein